MSAREVALDTNTFLLLLVGLCGKGFIAKSKRLAAYDEKAFDTLRKLVSCFDRVIVTPGCLSEVSNLLDFDRPIRAAGHELLAKILRETDAFAERYVPVGLAVENHCYRWLGITDATYVEIAKQGIPVVTADAKLFEQVVCHAPKSVNFATYTLG